MDVAATVVLIFLLATPLALVVVLVLWRKSLNRERAIQQALDAMRERFAGIVDLDEEKARVEIDLASSKDEVSQLRASYIEKKLIYDGLVSEMAIIDEKLAFAEMGEIERAWELFSIINPIHHGSTPDSIAKYRVEPYVVAADVYGAEPHIGRGGWTWYTGSSGWMYRLIIESLLGLHLDVDKLRFNPRPPSDWPSFKMHYRYRSTFYHIIVKRSGAGNAIKKLSIDGTEQTEHFVCLLDDQSNHEVVIELG